MSASLFLVFFSKELDNVLNLICMMGKYHIHKARYLKFNPNYKVLFKFTIIIASIFFEEKSVVSK